MRDKYTNQELYNWMVGQLSGLYFQSYQMAYDIAKRAERAYRHELGLSDSNFIQFGYWDSLKKGVLAGEKMIAVLSPTSELCSRSPLAMHRTTVACSS